MTETASPSLDIAVIGGDGIGPEVVAEGLKVLEAVVGAAGPKVTTTEYDLGARRWHATGETLPDSRARRAASGTTRSCSAPSATRRVPSGVLERGRAAAAALRAGALRQPAPRQALPRGAEPARRRAGRPRRHRLRRRPRGHRGPLRRQRRLAAHRHPATRSPPRSASTPASASSASCVTPSPAPRPARAGTSRSCTSTTCSPTPATSGGARSRRSRPSSPTSRPPTSTSTRRRSSSPPTPVGSTSSSPTTCSATSSPTSPRPSPAASGSPRAGNINPERRATRACSSRCTARPPTSPARARPTPPRRSSRSAMLLAHLGRAAEAERVEAAVAADLAERGDARRARTTAVGDAIAARLLTDATDAPGSLPRVALGSLPRKRTTSPMSLTFDLHRNPTSRAERRATCRDPSPTRASASSSPTTWCVAVWTKSGGWGDGTGRALRPDPADAERRGAALRPGDLRGPEGLPARRRLGLDVPPRGQRRADAAQRPPPGAARAADRRLRRVAARRWSRSTRRGCRRPAPARPASTCGRSCTPPRPSSACARPNEVTYCLIASPAGAYFAGGLKPVTLWISPALRPRRRRRHRRRQVRRQLRLVPRGPARGHRERLRPGRLPRLLDADLHRGARRDEPVLRHRATTAWSPPSSPARSSRASPAARSSSWPRASGLEPEERRIPIQEWKDGVASGEIREIFACGTAAVVTPVGELRWEGGSAPSTAGEGGGEVTNAIRGGPARHPVRPRRRQPRVADPARVTKGSHANHLHGILARMTPEQSRSQPSRLPDAVLRPAVGNAFEASVEQLATAIRLGVFAAGEQLPPERELAERLRCLAQHPARGDRRAARRRPGRRPGAAAAAARWSR